MNLSQFLDMTAATYPDKVAIICEGRRSTFRELKKRSDCLAHALQCRGITKGSTAAILSRNSIEYVEIICALMRIGAIGVPLNHRLTADEIEQFLKHSAAHILFYEAALQELVPTAVEGLQQVFSIGEHQTSGAVTYDELFSAANSTFDFTPINEDDPSFILYTAGTTGKPKGVVLTHRNQIWNTLNYTAALAFNPHDIELASTPLFHASTLGRVFTYIFNGVMFILTSTFDPQECLKIIEDQTVTSITQAPTMYQMMLNVFDKKKFNTDSVTRVVSGASSLPVSTKQQLKNLFPNAGIFDLYGITEAGPGVSILTTADFYKKIESVGKPMLSVEVKIQDEFNEDTPVGYIGEILCRGPNIMQGYFRDPESTANAMQGEWFKTGDLGWRDDDGFLYLAGRKKEIIISGGTNIYPGEIEEVLMQHPAVQDAAVIGVEDELWGERVLAVIVTKQDNNCTSQQLIRFCKERLAGFKCPKSVVFTKQIPRNAAQKVMKEELKKCYSK
jgi:fatty-acyl-CoA synthase